MSSEKFGFGIDFYLTKSCNKSCHYCTAWTTEMRNLDIDMEFAAPLLKWLSPYKARINLLGGEPALTNNLDEMIAEIKKYPNLTPVVLSNSLIRKFYPHILEDPAVHYVEHLVLDFYEDRIEKLGNYDFLEENENNNYNVIIMTPNFELYKKKHGLMELHHKNTLFKEYNSRSPTYSTFDQEPEMVRRLCSLFPRVPVIDFEMKKIRHCSKKVINGSRHFDVTQENIDKMMNFDLFEFEKYCQMCTEKLSRRGSKIEAVMMDKILDRMTTA